MNFTQQMKMHVKFFCHQFTKLRAVVSQFDFQNHFLVSFLVFHISTGTFSRSLALLASCWGHRPGWELGQALPTSSRRPCGPIGLARTSQRSVLRLLYLLHMPRDIPTRKHADNLLETASLLFVMVCFLFPQMSQLCLNRERERWEDTRADKRAPGEPSLQIITPAPGLFTYLVAVEATSCFCRHGRYLKDQLCVCLEKRLRADLSWDTRQQRQTGRRQSKSPHRLHVSLWISGVPATISFPTSSAVFLGYKWCRYVAFLLFTSALQTTGVLRQLHCKRDRWMITFPRT